MRTSPCGTPISVNHFGMSSRPGRWSLWRGRSFISRHWIRMRIDASLNLEMMHLDELSVMIGIRRDLRHLSGGKRSFDRIYPCRISLTLPAAILPRRLSLIDRSLHLLLNLDETRIKESDWPVEFTRKNPYSTAFLVCPVFVFVDKPTSSFPFHHATISLTALISQHSHRILVDNIIICVPTHSIGRPPPTIGDPKARCRRRMPLCHKSNL